MKIRKLNFSGWNGRIFTHNVFKTIFTKADLRMYVLLRTKIILIYFKFKNINNI